ncbi:MAG: NUDIX hydrolase [Elusimicrobia bacterium]|nr:NUDIX hydrolase [Elusimicrobiota bacterium]
MITKAMPLLVNRQGQHLELRNSADEEVLPATQLKSGEDARAAAKRALEEFFGFSAPEDAIKEGFQARVGNEVVAVYPVDVEKMEMDLLRPAESVASWAWRDVPKSMGDVVALGFPRNIERRNNAEAVAQYHVLENALAARRADLPNAPAHERPAREAEVAQALEDLRLLGADLGIEPGVERMNAANPDCPICDRKGVQEPHNVKIVGGKDVCEHCGHVYPKAGTVAGAGGLSTRDNAEPLTARALIRQNDGTIIAARQKDGRSLLPGGHLENGEDAESAVARELQEELGLDIKDALTGDGYDFYGEDGSKHRVFVVDGGKLDLSQLVPGDDVEDAEFVNSPFTDSHGAVHPPEGRENADTVWHHALGTQPACGKTTNDGALLAKSSGQVNCPKCLDYLDRHPERKNGSATCNECGNAMTADGKGGWTGHKPGCATGKKNDAGGDVAEIERHVEGIAHEVSELEKKNGTSPQEAYDFIKSNLHMFKDLPFDRAKNKLVAAGFSSTIAQNAMGAACREGLVGSDQTVYGMDRKNAGERRNTIEKLGEHEYRLLSHEGKNLGTFESHEAAAKHEGDVEYFKAHPKSNAAGPHDPDTCDDVQCPKCAAIDPHGTEHGIGPKKNAAGEKEWWCLTCGQPVTAADREPGGAHAAHEVQLVHRRNDAGDHGHMYPDRMNGAFPVLLCNAGGSSTETIATQETTDGWRCEACGDVIAGPPKPEQVVETL